MFKILKSIVVILLFTSCHSNDREVKTLNLFYVDPNISKGDIINQGFKETIEADIIMWQKINSDTTINFFLDEDRPVGKTIYIINSEMCGINSYWKLVNFWKQYPEIHMYETECKKNDSLPLIFIAINRKTNQYFECSISQGRGDSECRLLIRYSFLKDIEEEEEGWQLIID
ncbi:MAG: hypothetical protein OEW87_13990 [Flavobacteriaceae bacterium]|nr:hypothetical protein [Flavobacteriaceae bacterium]